MDKMSAICNHSRMATEERFPSDYAERFQVRMPPGLRDRIAAAAKANGRSMNAEIVHRLSESLEDSAITKMLNEFDATMAPHERVIVMFNEAMDAMMKVRGTIRREYGEESGLMTNLIEDDD